LKVFFILDPSRGNYIKYLKKSKEAIHPHPYGWGLLACLR